MSDRRLLVALLVVQSLALTALLLDRLIPEARAAEPMACTVANWPDALTGRGLDALRIRLDGAQGPLPIEVRGGDQLPIVVKGWQTYDEVRVKP